MLATSRRGAGPLSTSRSSDSSQSKDKDIDFDLVFQAFPQYVQPPSRGVRVQHSDSDDNVPIPHVHVPKSLIKARNIQLQKMTGISEYSTGVIPYPSPPFVIPKKKKMTECRSNIVNFFDRQGTY